MALPMNLTLVPSALILLRALIAPFLLWDALDGATTSGFLVAFVVAFLSDIFDGVIARKLAVSTPQLRQADGWADTCLYACIAVSAWWVHPDVVIACRVPLLSLLFVQLVWWVANLRKYGRPASYHTYSAKLWGITLFIAIVAIFGFNNGELALWLSCIVGVVHSIEEIAMTLILPVWKHDVLSIFHAIKLRHLINGAPSTLL